MSTKLFDLGGKIALVTAGAGDQCNLAAQIK